MLQPLPQDRISFVNLYQHQIFTKEEIFDQTKSRINKVSCFEKYKKEAEKIYPNIELNEEQ